MYRSWQERRQIIKSIIAQDDVPKLAEFSLTASEEIYFRARSAKAINSLAKSTSTFKSYYTLPTEKPFYYVIGIVALIVVGAVLAGLYIVINRRGDIHLYPLLAACGTAAVVAIGWAVIGWLTHRNTVRQNTNNILFSRFSHTPFGDALMHFHNRFGNDLNVRVTPEILQKLRAGSVEDKQIVSSILYLLNYYEFICSGILRGDFDAEIVRSNIRGLIIFYHDKCEPCISLWNTTNPKAYEHLIKVRTHYREP